jgi:trans-aconitate methyltransferase
VDSGARGRRGEAQRGARVADVGCGHGASTIVMAKAFPKSTFIGFDYHDRRSTSPANGRRRPGVADRQTFERARPRSSRAPGYDLVTFFDCLHDIG